MPDSPTDPQGGAQQPDAEHAHALQVEVHEITANSRTFARAFGDLRTGLSQRELWLQLGWQDIKQRYRRSVIGPFWITIATGVQAVAMGLLYSVLLEVELRTFLPHVTVGLIIWTMIQGAIIDGAEVFIKNEGLIKFLPSALSVHVYRLAWRLFLLFVHNILIYVIMLAIFRPSLDWSSLLAIPGLVLIMLNVVWVTMFFGIFATRYRDIQPILNSMTLLLFFMTPIVWTTEGLIARGGEAADRARIVEINPLYHYLEIVRAPMLGNSVALYHWGIVIACTVVGWVLTIVALRNYRARVPYWV
ncbi:galactan export ABC transporter permease subunit Wzm/RfbD [Hoyosella subflava]|uniref:Putative ABC transporter permease protein n=1 Tax=Hoyosella subflava (strain DSM 45089 / JCM 17490 / NBRC 109087 / DQS3-9A1) TaxID=443218 RepID=F6EEF7_HOYSD|nr:Putative ABC transporter permease protein [Hoyosella subflava DQS3-9A1]